MLNSFVTIAVSDVERQPDSYRTTVFRLDANMLSQRTYCVTAVFYCCQLSLFSIRDGICCITCSPLRYLVLTSVLHLQNGKFLSNSKSSAYLLKHRLG